MGGNLTAFAIQLQTPNRHREVEPTIVIVLHTACADMMTVRLTDRPTTNTQTNKPTHTHTYTHINTHAHKYTPH